MYIRSPALATNWETFRNPFSRDIWASILAFGISASVVIWFTLRLDDRKEVFGGFSSAILSCVVAISAISQQGMYHSFYFCMTFS